jgi:hypothetical protein
MTESGVTLNVAVCHREADCKSAKENAQERLRVQLRKYVYFAVASCRMSRLLFNARFFNNLALTHLNNNRRLVC